MQERAPVSLGNLKAAESSPKQPPTKRLLDLNSDTEKGPSAKLKRNKVEPRVAGRKGVSKEDAHGGLPSIISDS